MVPSKKLTTEEEVALWLHARQRLMLIQLKPRVSSDLVARVRAQLPPRQENETIGDLIRRASSNTQSTAEVKAFKPKPIKQFEPLAEFVRFAADTHEAEMPLPDAESALESVDGRFRLRITAIGDRIDIFIQALGFTADEFAHRTIGLANPSDENNPIAVITLDHDGDGNCQVKDTPDLRRALLRPVIVLIE